MTLGAPPQASGASFKAVMLSQNNAVQGLTLHPFSTPQISSEGGSGVAMTQQQLLLAQEQCQS
jgi:hypothetical protein